MIKFNKELKIEETNGFLLVTAELQPIVLAKDRKKIINTNYILDILLSMGYDIDCTIESALISNFRTPYSGHWKFSLRNKSKKKSKKLLDASLSEKDELNLESERKQ